VESFFVWKIFKPCWVIPTAMTFFVSIGKNRFFRYRPDELGIGRQKQMRVENGKRGAARLNSVIETLGCFS
jgi:hypothetical protein